MINELHKIIKDNKSGSLQILANLIKFCKKNLFNIDELKNVFKLSKEKLSQFAVIKNFIVLFEKEISNSDSEKLYKFLTEYESRIKNVSYSIYLNNIETFNKIKTYVTISFSKTILDLTRILVKEKRKISVFVLESRPILEGRKLALELKKQNVNVTLIVDANMCFAIKNADAVLIGADQILKNGNVINKIGSYPLAVCAKEFKKPFYVIADKTKYSNKLKFTPCCFEESEVFRTNKNIKIINQYFEEVPSKLISKILTD